MKLFEYCSVVNVLSQVKNAFTVQWNKQNHTYEIMYKLTAFTYLKIYGDLAWQLKLCLEQNSCV